MIFISFVIFLLVDQYQACALDGYVPLPPSIRQIAKDSVMVDWVAAASQKVDIIDYQLKMWEKDSTLGKNTIEIEGLLNNFIYITVQEMRIYSYQLMVKTSGMFNFSRTQVRNFDNQSGNK